MLGRRGGRVQAVLGARRALKAACCPGATMGACKLPQARL